MTARDVDLVRDGFERLGAEGYESMVPLIHPEFVMETPAALAAEPQRYEGVDGFRRWWTSFLEVMDEVTLEAKDFHEIAPGKIVIETVMRAVGGASGIETTQSVFMIATLRDGKMIRIAFATSLEAAKAGETV
ncbi:MAG TPA: nuclear transport factor 2 family protein [Solirubrobacterales bacterium]|nr:nuclear transport factor 2 family protein [Solirubrobacterales bacterium]